MACCSADTRFCGCRLRAVLVIFGGVMIHLTLSYAYTFGNFGTYVISYMRYRTGETSLTNVDALWVLSIGRIGGLFGLSVGGLLDIRLGPRISSAIGCAVFSAATMLSYFTVQQSFPLFIFSYGCMCQLGSTAAYGIPLATAMKWFPNRRGLAGGIILAGYGAGGIAFNQVITGFINPDNLSPDVVEDSDRYFSDDDLLDRVPKCFLVLGGIFLALQLCGIMFLVLPDAPASENEIFTTTVDIEVKGIVMKSDLPLTETVSEPDGQLNSNGDILEKTVDKEEIKTDTKNSIPAPDLTAKEAVPTDLTAKEAVLTMLKSKVFYLMWMIMFGVVWSLSICAALYKAYGQTFIFDDHFMALGGSLTSITNSLGRPFWGAIFDRFGFKTTIQCISAGFASLIFTFLLSERGGKPVFMLWIILMFLFVCGIWILYPSTLSKLYGTKYMAVNYGILQTSNLLVGIVSTVTSKVLKSYIGWHGLFFVAGSFTTTAFFVSFFFDGKDRNGKRI